MIAQLSIHSLIKFTNTPHCKAFRENSKFVGVLADPAIDTGTLKLPDAEAGLSI
jgi:hypothetical protein